MNTMLAVSRFSHLAALSARFGEQLHSYLPTEVQQSFADLEDSWKRQSEELADQAAALQKPTIFMLHGNSGAGKSSTANALAGVEVSRSYPSGMGTHVPNLIMLHVKQQRPWATVHVKDEEYLLHQVEEICKKADFASLDSIFGDGGWSWEDLDNPEPFKRRAAERRDQLIKKLAPTGGRFTADSNEKLTACLHDYVRPTTKDGEPQKAEWWPLVLEVHTHMTLAKGRDPDAADSLGYGLETDSTQDGLILAALYDVPGKDGEFFKQQSYQEAYDKAEDFLLVLAATRCNAPDNIQAVLDPVLHKLVTGSKISSITAIITKRDEVVTKDSWREYIREELCQGSVTDDEVVAFLESHAHRCQTKGPALRRKLQELQQLQQELPNVGQNKRTRSVSAADEANRQSLDELTSRYESLQGDLVEITRQAFDHCKTAQVSKLLLAEIHKVSADQADLLKGNKLPFKAFSVDNPAARLSTPTNEKRLLDMNSIKALRRHIRKLANASREDEYAAVYTQTSSELARVTDRLSIQAMSDHNRITEGLKEDVAAFETAIQRALAAAEEHISSRLKGDFEDSVKSAAKAGELRMLRRAQNRLGIISKKTEGCAPTKQQTNAFRGISSDGCYAGSISVGGRGQGAVSSYDLAEDMAFEFGKALTPVWEKRYRNVHKLVDRYTTALRQSIMPPRSSQSQAQQSYVEDMYKGIFPDNDRACKNCIHRTRLVISGAVHMVGSRMQNGPETTEVAHYERSGRLMRAAAQQASRAMAGKQVDQSLHAKQEAMLRDKLPDVVRAELRKEMLQDDLKDVSWQELLKRLQQPERLKQIALRVSGAFQAHVLEFDNSAIVQPLKRTAPEVADACVRLLKELEVKKQLVSKELLQGMQETLKALQSLKPDLSGSPAAAVVTKAFKTSWEQVELLGQYQLLLDDGREDEAALALLRLQEVVTASQVAETEEEGDEV